MPAQHVSSKTLPQAEFHKPLTSKVKCSSSLVITNKQHLRNTLKSLVSQLLMITTALPHSSCSQFIEDTCITPFHSLTAATHIFKFSLCTTTPKKEYSTGVIMN